MLHVLCLWGFSLQFLWAASCYTMPHWCRPLTVRGFTFRRLRSFTLWGVPPIPTLQRYEEFLKLPNLASRVRTRSIIYMLILANKHL